jgi:hypothetical protein
MLSVDPLQKLRFEWEVEKNAEKLWTLLVEKVGARKAKLIMRRVMGDGKLGRPKKPEERLLNSVIERFIRTNAGESDEKIAKRILERKLAYVSYRSGAVGIENDLKCDDVVTDDDGVPDIVVKVNPINKRLDGLNKRVQRIRREMIEDGSLPKEYAPRPYHRD